MSGLSTELYEKIKEDAAPVRLEVNGRTYTSKRIEPVYEPYIDPLRVRTLTGLVDYLKNNQDKLVISELICQIHDPRTVSVFSPLSGDFKQRDQYVVAEVKKESFLFGRFLDGEEFNIKLQACFVDTSVTVDSELRPTDKRLILKYVGNIKEGVVKETGDDGVSQSVTIKTGIARVEEAVLPNPVVLRPYRTFNEVEQPASPFIFRAKDGPQFALFEADNGAWESEAMKNIKEFLEREVEGLNVIA